MVAQGSGKISSVFLAVVRKQYAGALKCKQFNKAPTYAADAAGYYHTFILESHNTLYLFGNLSFSQPESGLYYAIY